VNTAHVSLYLCMCCGQLVDVEKNSQSVDVLHHQLADVKSQLDDSEQLVQQKQHVCMHVHYVQGGPKKRRHSCYIASNFTSEILLISTRFFAEIKGVSFLTRKHNFLKLIMYNSGTIW